MEKRRPSRLAIGVVAFLYFVTGKMGLSLAYIHPSATGVWPPAGIALAAFLMLGYGVWPGVFVAAFLVNLTTTGSVPVCLAIAIGNTLEGLAGAWLINRFAGGRSGIYRTPDIFKFALLGGLVSTAIAATFGATALTLGGLSRTASYSQIWTTWWLGDGVSNVLLAPLLILWISQPRLRWRRAQYLEAAACLVSIVLVGLVIFDGVFNLANRNYPIEYLCIPFLLWVAYRFGPRETAVATLVLCGTAIWGTLSGFGPFARASNNESLLLLQTFVGVVSVTTLVLATVFAERRIAEEQNRLLAVSDPLTGLGNYRKLIDALDAEIKRSDRTNRPFVFLLMDLDELKAINDRYGHPAGSRALCRLAEVLRMHSRGIDTAARYGGDEFALIVPEAGPDMARHISARIATRLANDGEAPAISVSIGSATFPDDGETVEQLLYAADRALYENKRRMHESTSALAKLDKLDKHPAKHSAG